MTTEWMIIITIWSVVSGVWSFLLLEQIRMKRGGLFLSAKRQEEAETNAELSRVCVMIPTRNPGPSLHRCIDSVLAQDRENLEILIIDDRTDVAHSKVLTELAADSRLRFARIDTLPEGWLGKSHALWTGCQQTEAEWMLFIDDDCELDAAAVRVAVGEAERRDVDLLSLWPRQAAGTFAEHLIIPLCGGIIAMWYGQHRRAGRKIRPFANGQFLLFRRSSYERIDGHRSVRDALIEDVAIAGHAAHSGLRSWVGSGAELFSVRMYDGFTATMNGWTRIFTGALHSGTRIILSILWLFFGSLFPFVAVPVLTVMVLGQWGQGVASNTGPLVALGVGAGHLAMMFLVSFRFWCFGHCPRQYLWLYPVSVVLVMAALVRSWWWLVVRRRVRWRDTTYTIDRRARIAC